MGYPRRKVLGFAIDAAREGDRWEWDVDSLHWVGIVLADGRIQLIGESGGVSRVRTELPDLKAAGWFTEGFAAAFSEDIPIRTPQAGEGGAK